MSEYEKATAAAHARFTESGEMPIVDCDNHGFPVKYLEGVGCALCLIANMQARIDALEKEKLSVQKRLREKEATMARIDAMLFSS